MSRRLAARWVGIVLLALASCARDDDKVAALFYVEQARGAQPERVRMLVGAKFVRIDDGRDGNDYLLYDRAARTIYSVSSTAKQTLVIPARAVPQEAPIALAHRVETDDAKFPSIAGQEVLHVRLLTNDKLCYDLHAARNLLPQAVAGLREYYDTLAGQQAVTLAITPKEFLTPCELANNVFAASRHLAHGLPVRFTDANGKVSELMDFQERFSGAERLFTLPADYPQLPIDKLRGESG
jgi:hypothetical protein